MKKRLFQKILFLIVAGILSSGFLYAGFNLSSPAGSYTDLQAAINAANPGATISWDGSGSPYQPANPIRVNKRLTIDGLSGGNKLVIEGATNASVWSGAKSAFLISTTGSGSTVIKNFKITEAYDVQCGVQNSGIWIGYDFNPVTSTGSMVNGVNNVTIENCEIYDCSHGITMNNCQDITIINNEIYDMEGTANTTSGGKGIVIWGNNTSHYLNNILIDGNEIYNNQYFGIVLDNHQWGTSPAPGQININLTISNNKIYNNVGWFTDYKECTGSNAGNYPSGYGDYYGGIGIISYGFNTGVTITKNEIYGHTTHTSNCANVFERASGIWSARDYNWVIKDNNIHDNLTGIYLRGRSTSPFYTIYSNENTGHKVTYNLIKDNTRGIVVDRNIDNGYTMYNYFISNDEDGSFYSGCGLPAPYGLLNLNVNSSSTLHLAEYNWWGDCSGPSTDGSSCYVSPDPGTPSGSGDRVSCYVDYKPWLGGNNVPALWLAPESFLPFSYANNTALSLWDDLTCPENDGILNLYLWNDVQREPKYKTSGINGFPSVEFDNTTGFPTEDGLKITSNISQLTTSSTSPDNTSKTVSVVFSYSGTIGGTTAQMLFEAGGSTSGYNIYLYNNRIYFGMYRGAERRYVSASISAGVHIAQLEYNGTNMRGILDGTATGSLSFTGIVFDNSFPGIAASSTGTRIHFGSFGQTWGLHFNGMIAEIIVYHAFNSGTGGISRVTYDYLDTKYNTSGSYPGGSPRESEIAINEFNEAGEFIGNSAISEVYPNPFTESAQFDVVVDESQFVRIELYNAMGQMVSNIFNGNIQGSTIYSFNIDGSTLPSGMYFLRVNGETINQSVPVVLTK